MKKNSKYIIVLLIVIALNESIFYLDKTGVSTDINIMLIVIITLYFIKPILNIKYRTLNLIFIFLLLNLITMILTVGKYGQPIHLALLRYRYNLIYLSYIPIYFLINKCGTKTVKKVFVYLGTTLAILYIIQILIYPKVIIFNMNYIFRGDNLRFYTGSYLIVLSLFMTIEFLLIEFNKKKFIALVIQITYILFVVQTRSITIGLIITAIIYSLINLKYVKPKQIVAISICLILLYPVFSPYIKDVIESSVITINEKESSSYTARSEGSTYMMNKLKESQLFGLGLYHNDYEEGKSVTGVDNKYYADDVGIIGYIFQFGYLGLIIYIVLTINMIKLVLKIDDRSKRCYYTFYIIYSIVLLPFNCIMNITNCILYTMITLSMIEIDANLKIKKYNKLNK